MLVTDLCSNLLQHKLGSSVSELYVFRVILIFVTISVNECRYIIILHHMNIVVVIPDEITFKELKNHDE